MSSRAEGAQRPRWAVRVTGPCPLVVEPGVGQGQPVQALLWNAPRWVWCALAAVSYALGVAAIGWVRLSTHTIALAVLGLAIGTINGLRAHARHGRLRRAAAPVPVGRQAEVLRAAARGPVPGDEHVRAAARRVVTHRLSELRDAHGAAVVLLTTGTVLSLGLAVTKTPWLLLGAAVVGGLLVDQTVYLPRRLRRRAQLLRSDTWD